MFRLSLGAVLDTLERILPWACVGGLAVFASFFPSSPLLPLLILLTLLSGMWIVGERVAQHAPTLLRPVLGLITLLAAQSVLQTAWYYGGGLLGHRSDGLTLAFPLGAFLFWNWLSPLSSSQETPPTSSWSSFVKEARWTIPLLLLGELLVGSIALFAHSAVTVQSINSPWLLLPQGVLAAFFLLFLCVVLAVGRIQKDLVLALLTGSLLFSVSSLTVLIYDLGFGFDGFLHRASELVLLQTGTLEPKPLYYLGQYVLVTWLSRLSGLPLAAIDRWLLPISAFLLPFFSVFSPSNRASRAFFIFFLLFFPFGILSTTTPQAFAYLLGLAGLFLAWKSLETEASWPFPLPWLLSFLLVLWALVTHPLAGLPFVAITTGLWWLVWTRRTRWPHLLGIPGLIASGVFATICIPVAFALHGETAQGTVDWQTGQLMQPAFWHSIQDRLFSIPASHLALWPDWADVTTLALRILLVVGAIFAYWYSRKQRGATLFLTLSGIGLWIAGAVLAQTGDFRFLIDYERGNYAERLFIIALLVVLPVACSGWVWLWERLVTRPPFIIAFWLLFFAALVSGSIYNALPRHDAAVIGHGWSVGASDLEAVRFIDKDAQNKPYTVLANQSVSAAAVSQFGFKRYAGDVFFYPIPTGGPLYRLFLDVTTSPRLAPIQQAAALGHSSRVYVVLNHYWWNAPEVQEKLAHFADHAWSVRDGEVTIFQFNVTSTSSIR